MPLPSIAGDIPLDQAGLLGPTTPAAGPPLSFFDEVKLGFKRDQAQPDWGFNTVNWNGSALSEINDALRKKGVQPATDLQDFDAIERDLPIQPGETYQSHLDRAYRTVFAQVAKVRATDPGFLKDYEGVADKGGFDHLIVSRRRAQLQGVAAQAPDGLGVGGFVGGFGHRAFDPINYLPVGGEAAQGASIGSRILQNGLRWGLFNAGVTTATEPLVRQQAQTLGIDRTNEDFAVDLLAGTALGFGLGGVIPEGLRFGKEKILSAMGKPAPPPTGTPFDSFDAKVANAFTDAVPPEQRTPEEQAAIHAIQRESEIKATSPFVPSPVGDDAHAASLDSAMHVLTGGDVPTRPAVAPVARENVAGPADVEATRMPARELVKARIHSAEGDGPNKLGGPALGPYQFEPRTWVSLFKRRYPGDQRGFDQIAALRTDPHLNDVLINDLIAENAAALRHAGFDESAGNLYLAHVLGHDRAVTVLRADPGARLGDLLPHDYFARNPFRPDDSAASLIHWAYGKMGDKSVPFHVATPEAAQGAEAIGAGEGDPQVQPTTGRFDVEALYGDVGMTDRPILKPELFDSPEEHAAAQVRFERQRDATDGFAPVMSRAEAFSPYEHFGALKGYTGTVTAEAMAEKLGIQPDEVRRTVRTQQSLDANSPFILARKRGAEVGAEATRVMRRPRPPAKSLIQFLSSRGGIHDAGGDLRAMDADVGRTFRKPLINNESGMGIDEALNLAIEHDYFPELAHTRIEGGTFADKPDPQVLLDAIDAELRGEKRLGVDEQLNAEEKARRAHYGEEPAQAAPTEPGLPRHMTPEERSQHISEEDYQFLARAAEQRGLSLDDDVLIDAADRIYSGQSVDEAIDDATMSAAARDAEEFAAQAKELGYDVRDELQAAYPGEFPEERPAEGGAYGEADHGDGAGLGRSPPDAGATAESRAEFAQSQDDPKRAEFGDPVGAAAEAQADSYVHDLEMAAHGSTIRQVLDRKQRLSLRLRWLGEQEKALGMDAGQEKLRAAELDDKEPWLEPDYLIKTYENDPDAGAAILEAIAEHAEYAHTPFRLDEDGGEHDLASILDDINEEERANTELRGCLQPKGGE